MGRKSIWKETELKDMHNKILEILDTSSLTTTEIARILIEKYPDMPEIKKWSAYVGDVARYVVARYLTFLKNRKYVELNSVGKWELIRKDSLRNEVIRAKAVEWNLSYEETALKLLDSYIEKNEERMKWQEYVKKFKEYERILDQQKTKLQEAQKKMKEASPI